MASVNAEPFHRGDSIIRGLITLCLSVQQTTPVPPDLSPVSLRLVGLDPAPLLRLIPAQVLPHDRDAETRHSHKMMRSDSGATTITESPGTLSSNGCEIVNVTVIWAERTGEVAQCVCVCLLRRVGGNASAKWSAGKVH